MIQAVRQTGELKMPKGGKLTPEEVQSLTDWVKMGRALAAVEANFNRGTRYAFQDFAGTALVSGRFSRSRCRPRPR